MALFIYFAMTVFKQTKQTDIYSSREPSSGKSYNYFFLDIVTDEWRVTMSDDG